MLAGEFKQMNMDVTNLHHCLQRTVLGFDQFQFDFENITSQNSKLRHWAGVGEYVMGDEYCPAVDNVDAKWTVELAF